MSEDEIETLAWWLMVNHTRRFWEIIRVIASGWPDATVQDIVQAQNRMNEIAMENFQRQVEPIKARTRLRLVKSD